MNKIRYSGSVVARLSLKTHRTNNRFPIHPFLQPSSPFLPVPSEPLFLGPQNRVYSPCLPGRCSRCCWLLSVNRLHQKGTPGACSGPVRCSFRRRNVHRCCHSDHKHRRHLSLSTGYHLTAVILVYYIGMNKKFLSVHRFQSVSYICPV